MKKASITIALTEADDDALERLVQSVPLANRHAIALAALRAGLDVIRQQPDTLMALLAGQRIRIRLDGNPKEGQAS